MVEAQYSPKQALGNGTYKLGAWFHSERFPDQRFDTAGMSLASPLSTGTARLLGSNYGVYGILDQSLFRTGDGNTGLVAFARAMGARATAITSISMSMPGLPMPGPFARDDDIVGDRVRLCPDRQFRAGARPGHREL